MSELRGGLEFMPVRLNVVNTIFELTVTKKITPAERNLVDLIEIGTVGAQNEKHQFSSKMEFYLDDLSAALRYKGKAKIWRLLKSLEEKGVITREKTRSKNKELLGLNPEMMGQILINTHHEEEKKRHLTVVVDNSKNDVDNSKLARTNRTSIANESFVNHIRTVRESHTVRSRSDSQVSEIINEKPLLDSSRLNLDSSRLKKETDVSSQEWDPKAPERAREILKMVQGLGRIPQ